MPVSRLRRSAIVGALGLLAVVALTGEARSAAPAAAPEGVKGRVESVILYRGDALVTRSVPVDAPAGTVELVVAELPVAIMPESLFAEGGAGVEVRAVRFRTRAVGEEPREEVRALDREAEAIRDKTERNGKLQQVLNQRGAYLDKLEGFVAPTANVEMAKGVLNSKELKELTTFSFAQRQAAVDELAKLAAEARDLAKQLSLIERKRAELAAGHSRTVREAVLFLDKRAGGRAEVSLSYLVSAAGWSPAYNFRAGKDRKDVAVEYDAVIRQTSGEDWTGVKLTLSTVARGLAAKGPDLAPFRVNLTTAAPPTENQPEAVIGGYRDAGGRKKLAERGQQLAQGGQAAQDTGWGLNAAANDMQALELAAGKDALLALREESAAGAADAPSVTYAVANPVSLASRADQQMVRIAGAKLASQFYNVAVPVLTSYVYREAELTNTEVEALLGGPVSVYLDDRFVGRGEIPTVARGESFVVGFGADPQLRAKRELADKTENVQGGNREITTKFRLVLENFKDEPVKVRVLDRTPRTAREADLRLTLDSKEKLSEDALYVRLEKPKGILRWEVDVSARAAGEKARILEYSYKLEFDRNMHLAAPGSEQMRLMKQEVEELNKYRAKPSAGR